MKDPALVGALHGSGASTRSSAARPSAALAAYDDPATPEVLIKAYPSLGPTERRDALNTLAAARRPAAALLAAVEAGKVPRGDLTADLVRQLRNLKDAELDAQIGQGLGNRPRDDRRPGPADRPGTRRCSRRSPPSPPTARSGGRSSPRSASSATPSSASAARSAPT